MVYLYSMHLFLPRNIILLLVCCSIVFLAGCGKGNDADTLKSHPPGRSSQTSPQTEQPGQRPSPPQKQQPVSPLQPAEYIKQVNKAQKRFAAAAAGLPLTKPKSAKQFQSSLGKFDGAIKTLVQELSMLLPPEKVGDLHLALINSIKRYGVDLRAAAPRLTAKDKKTVRTASQTISKASTTFSKRFDKLIEQINTSLQNDKAILPGIAEV